jgi:prepilin-type N-terminal cleavage/methylation domain-containing protein
MTAQFKKGLWLRTGFTLIELLIVMAVIGVLAVVILVAIDPVQQMARSRDTGRKSAVNQMGRALSAYFTAHNGQEYIVEGNTWLDDLQTAGEIDSIPGGLAYSANPGQQCSSSDVGIQNFYCYDYNDTDLVAVTYVRLESESEEEKCDVAGGEEPYFVWDSVHGRAGLVCASAEPTATTGGVTFEN